MKIEIKNPNHSYMYGFLLADGSLSEQSRNRGKVCIELKEIDNKILEQLSKELTCNYSLSGRSRDTNFKKCYQSCSLTIFDLEFRESIKSLGFPIGSKSAILAPPTEPFSEKDFWRGFIDGDGTLGVSVQNRPFIGLFTKSDKMATEFLGLIQKITGKKKICNKNTRDSGYNICVYDEDAQILSAYLYEDSNLYLERKFIQFKKIKNWKRGDNHKKVNRQSWTKEEDLFILNNSIQESVKTLHRTTKSIAMRKWRLQRVTV